VRVLILLQLLSIWSSLVAVAVGQPMAHRTLVVVVPVDTEQTRVAKHLGQTQQQKHHLIPLLLLSLLLLVLVVQRVPTVTTP
jgi:hypothetical protein